MSVLLEQISLNHHDLLKDMQKEVSVNLEQARRWADAVRRGCIFFYNKQEVHIGRRNIDWSGAHVDHQEWPAQLNRFFCLAELAAVTEAGEGDDLPALAREMIEDWIAQHEYSAAAPPVKGDNLLNLSIRLGQSTGRGWWPAIARLNCPEVFDGDFLDTVIQSCRGQLDCERQYMNLKGNWRISQLDSMIYCGLVVPGLDQHLAFAVRMLNECFHRQMNADGVHQEHCPSYHGWMCSVMTDYWRLSRARPELGLRVDTERLIRAWDYRVCSTLPDGGCSALNDSSYAAAPGSLESLLDQRARVLEESGLSGPEWDLERTPSRCFSDAGQIFLRTGWGRDDAMAVFDSSRWYGWHSHLGRNSVSLFAGGRYLLPDPGIFSYHGADPFAAYGRSTPAHNTINFAMMNQSEANPDLKEVHLFRGMALIQSHYRGGFFPGPFYGHWPLGHQPGIFGAHDRVLLWLGEIGCLVWDFCQVDQPGQQVNIHWNLTEAAEQDEQHLRVWSKAEDKNLLLQVLESSDPMSSMIVQGSNPPILGWQNPHPVPGNYVPSPMAIFQAKAGGCETRCLTLLLPFEGGAPPMVESAAFTCGRNEGHGQHITLPDGVEIFVAASPHLSTRIGESDILESDAALAAVITRNGEPLRSLLVNGMFLGFKGQVLADHPRAGTYYNNFNIRKTL